MALRTTDYDNDLQILARAEGIRTPRHITLDPDTASADANGRKGFPAGSWVGEDANGYGRILPRSEVTAVDGTTLTVALPGAFLVGDAVVAIVDGTKLTTDDAYGAAIGNVTAVDVGTGTITLSAAAGVAVGSKIGVVSKPLGLLLSGVDLSYDSLEYGLATSASVYGARLPYDDEQLARLFPEITQV